MYEGLGSIREGDYIYLLLGGVNENYLRCYCIFIVRIWGIGIFIRCWRECKMLYLLWKMFLYFFINLNIYFFRCLDICLREMNLRVYRKIYIKLFIACLFIIGLNWK